MLRFYNTLSGQPEPFKPMRENEVGLYLCGPTVWSFAHIGNFRTFIFGDVLRRHLKYKGYRVRHVMNLTDVDDRIINEAAAIGQNINDYTAPYIQAFWEDFDALGCERPEIAPRATEHIAEMVDIIEQLQANGRAYDAEGSIYYRISEFPEYGKLSKINFTGNQAGAGGRVATDKYDKESANDFALWKQVDDEAQTGWETSLGRGRPGWHIECSAMSMKYLGTTFDIHAGGIDLKFPHHENEIAQSEGATGQQFARYWLHSEHLKVEGETMSKSRGNYYTFRMLLNEGYSPVAIRYLLLSVPYSNQLNFTFDALRGAAASVERLRDFRARVRDARHDAGRNPALHDATQQALRDFEAGLDDNLNTAIALAAVHNFMREVNTALGSRCEVRLDNQREILAALDKFDTVLNVLGGDALPELLDADIQALIDERQAARHQRNFARADEIRQQLAAQGITLEDTKDGVRWKRK